MTIKALFFFVYFLVSADAFAAGSECTDYYRRSSAKKIASRPPYRQQIAVYLKDTLSSLESLRGRNHLLSDMAWVQPGHKIKIVNDATSGTNIAVDLLIQLELLTHQPSYKKAYSNISKVLKTLTTLERHSESGLFFSWYSTHEASTVASRNLSSIDNLHLAIALWTIAEAHPHSEIGTTAKQLFASMDFSIFYEPVSGFMSGNFTYLNGKWNRDTYTFSYLGSEARILYTAGWALGLFKQYQNRPDLIHSALRSITFETVPSKNGSLLKLWDGSAFQLLFPKMFVAEQNYSSKFKQMYWDIGELMIEEGNQRNLPFPAAHSPGVNHITLIPHMDINYNDKAGNRSLVSSFNRDLDNPQYSAKWDKTFTPYALFMAATSNPSKFLPIIKDAQELSANGNSLYIQGKGWLDGYNISSKPEDTIVQAQLAVNQGMIGLALLQMNSPDGMSASARAMLHNPTVRSKMQELYKIIDKQLAKGNSP